MGHLAAGVGLSCRGGLPAVAALPLSASQGEGSRGVGGDQCSSGVEVRVSVLTTFVLFIF